MNRGACALVAIGAIGISTGPVAHADDHTVIPAPIASTSTSGSSATTASSDTLAIIGPVLTQTGPSSALEPLRRVRATDPFAARAREVELALTDAAQDLSLAVDIAAIVAHDGEGELDLIDRAAKGAWVISPRVHPVGSDTFILRIAAVAPKSNTVLVRVEKVEGAQLSVRAVVMLRDLVTKHATPTLAVEPERATIRHVDEPERSRGRPILAASTSLLGLYAGFSIACSAGSSIAPCATGSDSRLVYPLLALGTGVGLGASLLAADEWDVSTGAAWTIAGGTWWGLLAGITLARAANVSPTDDRFSYGLAGGLVGTAAAVGTLAFVRFDEGDAALVHSGAALGNLFGGLVEMLAHGEVSADEPWGAGIGGAAGLVAGGAFGALLDTSAQRVLLVDLGAGLGALAGAASTSALLVDETATKDRIFVGSVLAGALLGGVITLAVTRDSESDAAPTTTRAKSSSLYDVAPTAGVLGMSGRSDGSRPTPIFGLGVTGAW